MNKKVSEITVDDIANYLRLFEPSEEEKEYIGIILNSTKDYILTYTGLKKEELDNYSELSIVVFILCSDLYDNRALYVEKNNINRTVESILNLHSRNLL